MEQVHPKTYYQLFKQTADGEKILEELCRRFYDFPSYERGDTHHTSYNEGSKAVIHYILRKMAQSQQQEETGEQND